LGPGGPYLSCGRGLSDLLVDLRTMKVGNAQPY
jgi:hypothetical protein